VFLCREETAQARQAWGLAVKTVVNAVNDGKRKRKRQRALATNCALSTALASSIVYPAGTRVLFNIADS
jgi:hypothetical protein